MLKNEDLINKLSKEEKINLIYNLSSLNGKFDLPSFNLKKLSEIEGDNFNNDLNNLLYSWNDNLFKEYGRYISNHILKSGNNLILTESLSPLVNNHIDDDVIACEDPLLLGSMLSSFYKSIKDNKINLVLNYDLLEKDLPYIKKSARVVDDFFLSPLNQIASAVEPDFALLSDKEIYKEYSIQETTSLYSNLLKHEFSGSIIADSYSKQAPYNLKGYSLKNNNKLNPDDYDETELDTKLDNLISKLNIENLKDDKNAGDVEFFNRSIYAETSVLLKNKNQVLPLTKNFNLFVLGNIDDITNTKVIDEHPNLNIKSYYRKTLGKKDLNNKIINGMISNSNAMLLLLNGKNISIDEKKIENIILKCKKNNQSIILFASDYKTLNYSFVKYVDSIIFNTKYDSSSFFDLISGKLNPSGRLINSNQDLDIENIRRLNKKEIGNLVGYRYLDTNNENPKLSFGYGLSYSKFNYSNINITSENVVLTVSNISSFAGYDTLQVYIGVNNSKLIRPKRELKTFKKIFLKPGERKQIVIEIPKDAYNYYSKEKEDFDIEAQMYTIYLTSSFDNIIYSDNVYVEGNKNVVQENDSLDNYLLKVSNKHNDRYKFKNNSKALNTKVFTVILVLLLLAINGFLIWNDLVYYYNPSSLLISLVLVNLVFVFGFILLRHYSKVKKFENYQDNEGALALTSIDDMFDEYMNDYVEDFNAASQEESETEKEDKSVEIFNDNSLREYIDDFSSYLLANGLKLDEENLKLFIASFASSKLIFIKNSNKALVNKLVNLTNLYFNEQDYQDESIINNPTSVKELFTIVNDENEEVNSSFKRIIDNANLVQNKIYVTYIQLEGKDASTSFLMDFSDFYENRNSSYTFEFEESLITIPKNLWTFISIDSDYDIDQIDPSIIKNAIILPLDINEIEIQKVKKNNKLELSYVDFIDLVKACKNDYYIGELNYKKIDELQKFVNSKNDYSISTKVNYSIEDFLAVLLYLESEELDALDELFAYKIIPLAKSLLKDVDSDDANLEDKIEKLLDDNHQEHSLKMI